MRVIGGAAKGRRLKVPRGRGVRPTADRVKEALFNILPRDLSSLRVLDLFAGTGNLSVEALSRGASEAVLVDLSRRVAGTIRENLETLGFSQRSRVLIASAPRALRLLARTKEVFDLVFLDPPYERGWSGKILRLVEGASLLSRDAVVVVEHSVREALSENYGRLRLRDQRRYGSTALSFFRLEESEDSLMRG